MRRAALIVFVSVAGLATSAVALGHGGPYAWTVAKARVLLQEGTTISLPSDQRQALNAEIDALLAKLRLHQLTAQERSEDWLLAATYDNYIKRFQKAQDLVNKGLSIDTVSCVGSGKPLSGKRYRHFRCPTSSYVLEIPTIEFEPGANPALPEVVEGPVRRIGPLQAVFTVHVTGKSRMLSQRAS